MTMPSRRFVAGGALAAIAAILVGCRFPAENAAAEADPPPARVAPHPIWIANHTGAQSLTSDLAAANALELLAVLPVHDAAEDTPFDPAAFGPLWSDDVTVAGGHNGCDTRNDILRRDLRDLVTEPGSNGCEVLSGVLHDPYTGADIPALRSTAPTPETTTVSVDHVVALADAWRKGAQALSAEERRNFANDPRNLLTVSTAANRDKGDNDAARWLPPNPLFRCSLVITQVEVKSAYRLWVTAPERDAMRGVLTDCGSTRATTSTSTSKRPA